MLLMFLVLSLNYESAESVSFINVIIIIIIVIMNINHLTTYDSIITNIY